MASALRRGIDYRQPDVLGVLGGAARGGGCPATLRAAQ